MKVIRLYLQRKLLCPDEVAKRKLTNNLLQFLSPVLASLVFNLPLWCT